MKYYIKYAILSAILLLAASCSSNQVTDERLLAVENIMDARPDSALQLLQNIDNSKLSTDYDKAMFALLYSQALDKNYIDLENDSIISLATKYFEKIEDTYHLSLASFYHGRVLMNAKKYAEAACYMLQAFENAEVNEDYFWMGRAYEYLAMIYDSNFYGTEAVEYMKKGFVFMQKSGRQPYVNYSLLELMRIQQNNRKYDDCIATGYLLLDSALVYNDKILETDTKGLLAHANFGLGNYKKAVDYFEEIRDSEYFRDNSKCLLGISYLNINENKKAENLLKTITPTDNEFNPFFLKYYKYCGKYEQAFFYLDREYNLLAKELSKIEKQNFANKIDEFRKIQKAELNTRLDRERIVNTLLIIGIILLFIVLITTFIYFYRKSRIRIEENVAIADSIEDVFNLNKSDINQNEEFKKIFMSRVSVINQLGKNLCEKDDNYVKTKISNEVIEIISSFSIGGDAFKELETYINTNCDSILTKFKVSFPKIKDIDYAIFTYSIIGFNTSAMALFLSDGKTDFIYNRRYRLKTKIRNSNMPDAEVYLKLL